jgi:hypothetical protein
MHFALMMTQKVEQHMRIQFCQKLGHSCSGTHDMIQKTFGNQALGHTQVKKWYRRFKEEWMSVESDEHSGMPSISRNKLMIDKVNSAVLDNQRITITELSDELVLSLVWYSPF